jgi:hypothetical protein
LDSLKFSWHVELSETLFLFLSPIFSDWNHESKSRIWELSWWIYITTNRWILDINEEIDVHTVI